MILKQYITRTQRSIIVNCREYKKKKFKKKKKKKKHQLNRVLTSIGYDDSKSICKWPYRFICFSFAFHGLHYYSSSGLTLYLLNSDSTSTDSHSRSSPIGQ